MIPHSIDITYVLAACIKLWTVQVGGTAVISKNLIRWGDLYRKSIGTKIIKAH